MRIFNRQQPVVGELRKPLHEKAVTVSLQCRCVAFTGSDGTRRALHRNPADQPFPITRLCHKRSVQNDKTNPNPCSILGWDKHSYGYHGDDGHSFCSSGTGQPYGPTFTTGDVIGCCVNLINNTCFYTKNGISLGASACHVCCILLLQWPIQIAAWCFRLTWAVFFYPSGVAFTDLPVSVWYLFLHNFFISCISSLLLTSSFT